MPMMDHEEFLNQKHQVLDGSQGHASLNTGHYSWPSSTGQVSVSWNSYPKDNSPIENGTPASSAYYYDPQKITVSGDAQGEISAASHASTSSILGEANITQGYTGYTDFSGYHTAGFQNYYYGYQQPAIDSSSQQVVASQNSGAPYQPLSSFQNAGSYASPTSYSGTHYNTGDHQTTAGYNYSNQTNIWNDANSGSYPLHHYSSYTPAETNSTPTTSSVATNPLHYHHHHQQQQYNQWSFYNASAPIVSCAPGTENTYATTASATACPAQNGSGSYPYPSNQPPPPGTTSWGRDSGSAGVPSLQVTEDVMTYNRKNGWEVGTPGYQNNQMPLYFQKPFDSASPHKNCEDQQKPLYFQVPSSQYPNPPIFSTNQVSEKFQTPLQTVTTVDTRRVSKMQIPTNPRIASNLALGVPKTDKESSTANAAMKPAYVSVSVPKLTKELSSHVDEAMIKGTFPTSLRAYVERTFARCKDDAQRAANQNKMKEMITKASADGSLFTRNWDVEPLFSLPNISDNGDQNNVQSSVTVSSLPKYRRSPNRSTKSRWEPIAEETLVEKLESATNSLAKDLSWDNLKATEKAVDSSKFLNKDQSLTKYYASAIVLADTPDEKKRREHRSKRFEKGHENQTEVKHIRSKSAGSENTYIRRASAVVLAKNSEDSCSRAVEDIDWDAHTVKGTSQEVEKRYLRLTSAPDPATVRPEEVLEKALHAVQTSSKNYLYKCDKLKSIRQDLTVQRIQNELTVKVYETHARLALESGDLPEYNQCQSQLNSLYAEGIKGAHMEFSAYNFLCVILHSNNYRELLSSMARLSDEAKENDAVKHALAVRSAVSSGNYILFFRLYKSAPNLNTCLMDLYVERIRFEAVKCMSKSYRPSVPVTYIARILSFSSAAPPSSPPATITSSAGPPTATARTSTSIIPRPVQPPVSLPLLPSIIPASTPPYLQGRTTTKLHLRPFPTANHHQIDIQPPPLSQPVSYPSPPSSSRLQSSQIFTDRIAPKFSDSFVDQQSFINTTISGFLQLILIISNHSGGIQRYFVCWSGHPNSDTTWITSEELQRIDQDLLEYYRSAKDNYSTESSSRHPGRIGGDTEQTRPATTRFYTRWRWKTTDNLKIWSGRFN